MSLHDALPIPAATAASREAARMNGAAPARPYVVRRSPVHGKGVFAAQPIRKGERILEYKGRRVDWDWASAAYAPVDGEQIGRAHVCTPVTNAHLVCCLLLEKKTSIMTT